MGKVRRPDWNSWLQIPLVNRQLKRKFLLADKDVVELLFAIYMGTQADPSVSFDELVKKLKGE